MIKNILAEEAKKSFICKVPPPHPQPTQKCCVIKFSIRKICFCLEAKEHFPNIWNLNCPNQSPPDCCARGLANEKCCDNHPESLELGKGGVKCRIIRERECLPGCVTRVICVVNPNMCTEAKTIFFFSPPGVKH